MKCTKCGNEFEGNFCPNCGNGINNTSIVNPQPLKPKKKKKGCLTVILTAVIGMFVFSAVMGIMFGEEEPKDSQISSITSSNVSSEKKTNKYETKKDLITFQGVEADFVKLYDPKAGVTALAVSLDLKNTGAEEVTVTLSDGYVNDTKVQFMTGLPVTIAPGKKAVGVYMFGYDGLDFSKVEDIKKIEFKISLLNSNWDSLKTSETVVLNFE